jgi:hypothetical protein
MIVCDSPPNVFQVMQAARSHDAAGTAIRHAIRQHNLNGSLKKAFSAV